MEETGKWIRAAGIRAIKTMAQTAVALIGTSVMMQDVDWMTVLSAAVLSGVLSILTSLGGLPELNEPDIKIKIGDGTDMRMFLKGDDEE